ncbi:Branched-chain-amino-acid aminotransferase, partial [Operophtera brumata]
HEDLQVRLAAPYQLNPKPEAKDLGFGRYFSDHMLKLFEGMKAYRGVDDKIRLFRPDLNMERMNLAAQRSGLPMFDGEELVKCIERLVQIDQEIYRFLLQPTFGIMAPESALLFVILSPVSAYYKASTDGAVSIYADPAVVRAFPGGVGNRKVGSNYGPTIVLWLFGPNHELTEVGAMNIFMVSINDQGGKLIRIMLSGLYYLRNKMWNQIH